MNDKQRTKQYTLSSSDNLPLEIDDPGELIKKITKKITINSTATNLNDLFPWVELAEKTLERYKEYDDKLIMCLQYNLARIMFEKLDYNRAKTLMEEAIKKCIKINSKKLAEYYWLLAIVLCNMGNDYDAEYYVDAKENIEKAIALDKDNPNNHCVYADILFGLCEYEEAENHYKKALEISIEKRGKDHPKTASFYSSFGIFYYNLGKYNKARNYQNKAYRVFRKENGEENLYTVRILGHIANLDYNEQKYESALKKMKKVFLITGKIKGDDNKETKTCKNNCGEMHVMLKQYDAAINYFTAPFAIVSGKEGLFLLLDYNKDIMSAPQMIISEKGVYAEELIKIARSRNIPMTENHALAKGLMKDCVQFQPVLEAYYEPLAKIMAKTGKYEAS